MDLKGRSFDLGKICFGGNSCILDFLILDPQGDLGGSKEDLFPLSVEWERRHLCVTLGSVAENSCPQSFGRVGVEEHFLIL